MLLGAGGHAVAQQQGPRQPDQDFAPEATLRAIRVSTRDIFDADEASGNVVFRLANWIHATTEESVVRREIWFETGRPIRKEQVDELARNLRAMRLFGEVDAELIDAGGGQADVEVRTRDRFSLVFGGGAGVTGGVTKFSGTIGERNLFGLGKRISLTSSREDEDSSHVLSYGDPQLFGSWYQANVRIGTATEGPFGSIDVFRPFKHLEDPWSYGVSASTVDREVDYYQRGEVVASVPEDSRSTSAYATHAFGPRDTRGRVGVDVAYHRAAYDSTIGDIPGLVTPPGDTDEFQLGVSWGLDWVSEYRVERRIDTIDFDEDVRLGVFVTARTALAYRSEQGQGSAVQPLLEIDARAAASPLPDTYTTFQVEGGLRLQDSDVIAHRTRSAVHLFQKSLPSQTLALSLLYDQVTDRQGLPPQLTLGEDGGLRGYPARQFASDRYLLLNVEDRIDTGLELWSVHLGVAAFADVGWIDDPLQDVSMSSPLRSVGVGLRLGSSELLGGGIARIDLAIPLDDAGGQSFELSISASRSQVFGFFGNALELASEFADFLR